MPRGRKKQEVEEETKTEEPKQEVEEETKTTTKKETEKKPVQEKPAKKPSVKSKVAKLTTPTNIYMTPSCSTPSFATTGEFLVLEDGKDYQKISVIIQGLGHKEAYIKK